MALIVPAQADFTAYNSPAGLWGAGGWSIAMPSSHSGDTNWHGYERPWPGTSVVAGLSAVYDAFTQSWEWAMFVRRGTAAIILGQTTYLKGGGNLAMRWTLPGTFSAFIGGADPSNTSTNDGLDFANPRSLLRIGLSGTTLTWSFSTGYPLTDPPWVVKPNTESTATWLGGAPTHWGVLTHRIANTNNRGIGNFWGYEETV